MLGYHKTPEATARAFAPDGWLATGDLGYRDADGFYFITGRLKELIIKGGENIAPREIDEALLQHPAVLEAAAVGMPDPRLRPGDPRVRRRSRPDATCTEDELRAHCLHELGRYKTPKLRSASSPSCRKGPSGKVQRLRLVDLWTQARSDADSRCAVLDAPSRCRRLRQRTVLSGNRHRNGPASQVDELAAAAPCPTALRQLVDEPQIARRLVAAERAQAMRAQVVLGARRARLDDDAREDLLAVRASGTPTAAASSTAGCASSASSISRGAMFSPPLMISSLRRPVMK